MQVVSYGQAYEAIDKNLEMADMSNPEGLIFGHVWRVTVSTDTHTYTHHTKFSSGGACQKFTGKVRDCLAKGGELNPAHWDSRKTYGSPGWSQEDEQGLMSDGERERSNQPR